MPTQHRYAKAGATIEELEPWKIVPLFVDNEEVVNSWYSKLPKYKHFFAIGHFRNVVKLPLEDKNGKILIEKLLRENIIRNTNKTTSGTCSSHQSDIKLLQNAVQDDLWAVYSIVAAVYLIASNSLSNDNYQEFISSNEFDDDCDEDTTVFLDTYPWSVILNRYWKQYLQEYNFKMSLKIWKRIIYFLYQSIYIVSVEHPLQDYATKIVPTLSQNELNDVIQVLQLPTCIDPMDDPAESVSSATQILSLAVSKHIQDLISDVDRSYAVFFHPIHTKKERNYSHSCLPTAHLTFLPINDDSSSEEVQDLKLNVISLYEKQSSNSNTAWSLCLVQDDVSVEQRETFVMRRFGEACGCSRCRWESIMGDAELPNALSHCLTLSCTDAITLGRFYMSQRNFPAAKLLYEHAGSHEPTNVDVAHALGAIELSQNNFIQAQKIWNHYANQYPESCIGHSGIQLQMDKIRAYQYLDSKIKVDHDCKHDNKRKKLTQYQSILPNIYVSDNVVSQNVCQQVINWAESAGKWTQERHYAVPTHDVAIHSVPSLLKWFLDEFWFPTMKHILANQFGCSNYFIHDAFCVRYDAEKKSNHLPIRTFNT
jgi:tetratricopeptide (TPR) repeat protein